ncbi:MAG TPA: PH domain-containing protein [Candidatus Saccharimonadales bacterium]|nr:PH domain-containing protein [Candidatus Saccharimonadales bacterium]
MNEADNQTPDYNQPVAYDAEGRPLYAHPPVAQAEVQAKTQVVHMTRPIDPERAVINDATKLKHDRSKRIFPTLNLSEGEYVISAVRRHPIGLVIPLAIGMILITLAFVVLFNYDVIVQQFGLTNEVADISLISIPILAFILLVALLTYVFYYVYVNNKFFLTNESVIQEIQTGLFSRHEQTVSLANIEDASFYQSNIIQQFFDYGSIRLSTQGDETTYHFTFVAKPKQHIETLNNAVEAFKNGRPVGGN